MSTAESPARRSSAVAGPRTSRQGRGPQRVIVLRARHHLSGPGWTGSWARADEALECRRGQSGAVTDVPDPM